MKTSIPESDLPVVGEVFNLVTETAVDGARLVAERLAAAAAKADAEIYTLKMQRTFKECPGFVGGDLPDGELKKGCVEVEPAKAPAAMVWLKRRFHVNDELRVTGAELVAIEIMTRQTGRRSGPAKKRPVSFAKPVQYTLSI